MAVLSPGIPITPSFAAPASVAAELAARIPIPVALPERYDGQRIRHLSNSSYNLFLMCPEAWRRRYIAGEKAPPTGAMFLGSRVDDAVSLYYRAILERDERLDLSQAKDAYRALWQAELEIENEKLGVDWEDIHPQATFEMGLAALELSFEALIPKLGDPVAVQRKFELKLAPSLQWTILGYIDLETQSVGLEGKPVERVVDYKVNGSPIAKGKADEDSQASLYLAERWLERKLADEFCFAQIGKPGPRRKQMSATLVSTTRSIGQLRSCFARIAQAASQIVLYHERYGPERSWGFADPTSWKCGPRYCEAWASCPGGGGL